VSAASWSWGDGSTTNGLYVSHQYSVNGNYNICLSVTVSCSSSSSSCATYSIFRSAADIINVNVVPPPSMIQSVTEQRSELLVSAFPNPAHSELSVQINELFAEELKIHLTDLLGRPVVSLIENHPDVSFSRQLDVSECPEGLYFLTIQAGARKSTHKIVIQR
jgi:hypothetical protein